MINFAKIIPHFILTHRLFHWRNTGRYFLKYTHRPRPLSRIFKPLSHIFPHISGLAIPQKLSKFAKFRHFRNFRHHLTKKFFCTSLKNEKVGTALA